jgi:hypothetical protein
MDVGAGGGGAGGADSGSDNGNGGGAGGGGGNGSSGNGNGGGGGAGGADSMGGADSASTESSQPPVTPLSPNQLRPAGPVGTLGAITGPASSYGIDNNGNFDITPQVDGDLPVDNSDDKQGVPRPFICDEAQWVANFCQYFLSLLGLESTATCDVAPPCNQQIVFGKKFTLSEAVLNVPVSVGAGSPEAAVKALQTLTNRINAGNAAGIRTYTLPNAHAVPAPAPAPTTVVATTGTQAIVRIIIIGTTQAFDTNARGDFITALAQLYGAPVTAANVEILSANQVTIPGTSTGAVAVIVRITDSSAASVSAIVTKLQSLVRANNNKIGAYTVFSIDQDTNAPMGSGAWSRPSVAVFLAAAALVIAMLF